MLAFALRNNELAGPFGYPVLNEKESITAMHGAKSFSVCVLVKGPENAEASLLKTLVWLRYLFPSRGAGAAQ